jgi:hypothetical protein
LPKPNYVMNRATTASLGTISHGQTGGAQRLERLVAEDELLVAQGLGLGGVTGRDALDELEELPADLLKRAAAFEDPAGVDVRRAAGRFPG